MLMLPALYNGAAERDLSVLDVVNPGDPTQLTWMHRPSEAPSPAPLIRDVIVTLRPEHQDLTALNRPGSRVDTALDVLYPRIDDPTVPWIYTRLGERAFNTGVLRQWTGDVRDVTSPLRMRDVSGNIHTVKLGTMPWLSEADAITALDTAAGAWDNGCARWATMLPEERMLCLDKFIGEMLKMRETVITLLQWEIGKSKKLSATEFDRTIETMRLTIAAVRNKYGLATHQDSAKQLNSTSHTPRGVALCIGPFNYPLNETFATLFAALAGGNSIVFKTAKKGQLLMAALFDAFVSTLPPGVVNCVSGDGRTVNTPIMKDGRVDLFAFIGSTGVAKILTGAHPHQNRLHQILGLGAKNPAIVLPHADVKESMTTLMRDGVVPFNSQRCTAPKIIFLHEDIADEAEAVMVDYVNHLRIGSPHLDPDITALPEENEIDPSDNKVVWLENLINDALVDGAKILNPGGGVHNDTFMIPAVVRLNGVNTCAKLLHEEQFGPVFVVVRYKNWGEIQKWLDDDDTGQQAAVFGTDPDDIAKIKLRLANRYSRVFTNQAPARGPDIILFDGRRDSGMGALSIAGALEEVVRPGVMTELANELGQEIRWRLENAERRRALLDEIEREDAERRAAETVGATTGGAGV